MVFIYVFLWMDITYVNSAALRAVVHCVIIYDMAYMMCHLMDTTYVNSAALRAVVHCVIIYDMAYMMCHLMDTTYDISYMLYHI
jgi:hypothetical protein